MSNEQRTAVLRGFNATVDDLGDGLHLRHPLISLGDDPKLYVARRFNWLGDQSALSVADRSEASELGTLLPDARPVVSGEGVVVAGARFVEAAESSGVRLTGSDLSLEFQESGCLIGTTTQAGFDKLRVRLAGEALTVFDNALGDAVRVGSRLSERGEAAFLVLRGCGTRWREDVAVRELAGARQNGELDLYRRLLDGFEIELDTPSDDLHGKVERHIQMVSSPLRSSFADLELDSLTWPYDRVAELAGSLAFELFLEASHALGDMVLVVDAAGPNTVRTLALPSDNAHLEYVGLGLDRVPVARPALRFNELLNAEEHVLDVVEEGEAT